MIVEKPVKANVIKEISFGDVVVVNSNGYIVSKFHADSKTYYCLQNFSGTSVYVKYDNFEDLKDEISELLRYHNAEYFSMKEYKLQLEKI